MRAGWYIVNYHAVDYEDSILTRALGGTTRPDVFAQHVRELSAAGRFISVEEGQRQLESGRPFDKPVFSLWFDDGYRGMYDHVAPVCRRLGIQPALSICSRFILRREMFWRAKLSYLAHTGGLGLVRERLRLSGGDVPFRLRAWTLHHFTPDLVQIIDEVYRQSSHESFRCDAFRMFLTPDQLSSLKDEGWLITNHSATHYPLAAGLGWEAVRDMFEECETLAREYSPANRYWVLPFGYGSENYTRQLAAAAVVVDVGDRRNTVESWRSTGRLFRHAAPGSRNILSHLT